MDPNRAKVSLGKRIKPYIHGQTEYMIRTSKRSPLVVVHWLVSIFDTVDVLLLPIFVCVVVSRVKKGGTSTYCGKGEVMVASPEQLITLGIWEYQRFQRREK